MISVLQRPSCTCSVSPTLSRAAKGFREYSASDLQKCSSRSVGGMKACFGDPFFRFQQGRIQRLNPVSLKSENCIGSYIGIMEKKMETLIV